MSHSGSPSACVSWVKTTFAPERRAPSNSPRITGIVPSASGTTSEPPSLTKSFCMSTTTRAVFAGSSLTSSWISYSGTSTVWAISSSFRPTRVSIFYSPGGPRKARSAPQRIKSLRDGRRAREEPPFGHFAGSNRSLLAPERGQHLPDEERREDEGGTGYLQCGEPVSGEPVAKKGCEDRFHGEDDRRPGCRYVLLDGSLYVERRRRGDYSRHQQGDPDPR